MSTSSPIHVREAKETIVARPTQGRRQTTAPKLQLNDSDGPIERRVYNSLRFALMSGEMLPGQMLTSRSLSEQLGVSQTPIMVALKRLEADHALQSRNRSAFYVSEPGKDEFREILDIRLTLEVMAIRRAVRNLGDEDIARLKQINRACGAEAGLPRAEMLEAAREALAQNFRFHFEIYRHCGSITLVELIERFWLRVGPMLHRYFGGSGVVAMPDLHESIIAALERRDEEGAELALRYDLNAAFSAIVPQLPA